MPERPSTFSPFAAIKASGLMPVARRESDERRGSANDRGYTSRWQRSAAGYLREHPLCCCCKANGYTRPARLVDHVQPRRLRPDLFWSPANWQPLCDNCHNAIKAVIERRFEQGQVPAEALRLDRPLPEFFALF